MVSLVELSKVTEEGVEFKSPHDNTMMLLTPEKSMEIQNAIGVRSFVLYRSRLQIKNIKTVLNACQGADIMMQLDDVVSSTLEDQDRMKEAMLRSIRWLDRCIAGHKRKTEQNLFPIVQGGLDPELRTHSAKGLTFMILKNRNPQ